MPSPTSILRLAFLGADESTPGLIRAVIAGNHFDFAGICELDTAADPRAVEEILAIGGRVPAIGNWESLLDSQRYDAVVVARSSDDDRRSEQLRKLIQTSVPLLTSHPVVGSMLIYYELDMIRRETGSLVLPTLVERRHPGIRALANLVAQGEASPIGKVEQVSFERSVTQPTKAYVERQFARDIDLIRTVAGDVTRLGAMAATAGDAAYASLGVQMSGPAAIAARWSVVPMQGDAARLVVTGSRGKATLHISGDDKAWAVLHSIGAEETRTTFDAWNASDEALDDLSAALVGKDQVPDWLEAARCVELAETIQRSLKKSRTIDLYYEDFTEDGTFKGTMTSVGCGLLLLGMGMLGVVGVAEQLNVPMVKYWPYLLVSLLGVFLFLQLVMLTKGKEGPRDRARAGEPDEGSDSA